MRGRAGFVTAYTHFPHGWGCGGLWGQGNGGQQIKDSQECILESNPTMTRSHLWLNSELAFSTQSFTKRQRWGRKEEEDLKSRVCPSYKDF